MSHRIRGHIKAGNDHTRSEKSFNITLRTLPRRDNKQQPRARDPGPRRGPGPLPCLARSRSPRTEGEKKRSAKSVSLRCVAPRRRVALHRIGEVRALAARLRQPPPPPLHQDCQITERKFTYSLVYPLFRVGEFFLRHLAIVLRCVESTLEIMHSSCSSSDLHNQAESIHCRCVTR